VKILREEEEQPWVPEILKVGSRGTPIKIWTLLYLNQSKWFTAKEIAKYLGLPLSTIQFALKDLRRLPRVICQDEPRRSAGRPRKRYKYGEREYNFAL